MKNDLYTKFGYCWNNGDFSSFSKKLLKECTYNSFDYFYKLKGRDKLTEFLKEQAASSHSAKSSETAYAYTGYYQKTDTALKTIKECCLIVRQSDLKTLKILTFAKRFGKIASIQGLDPDKVKSIRERKIE